MKALFTLYDEWAIVRPESTQFSEEDMQSLKASLSPEQQEMLYWDEEAQGYAMQVYEGHELGTRAASLSDMRALSFAADTVFDLDLFHSKK